MATRVGVLLSGIAVQSLLAYALLPTGRGEFAVCILFAALLGVLLTPGADAGAQYFVMAKEISVSQGVSVSLLICLVGAGLATALSIPLIHSDIAIFRKAEPLSFHLSLFLVPLTTFSSAVQHQLAGLRRLKSLALLSVFQTAANGLSLVFLVIGLKFGVNGALMAACVGNLVMIIGCVRDLQRRADLTWVVPSRSALAQVVRYGIRFYIARIGWGSDVRVGVFLLGMVAGRDEIGLFAVASGLMARFLVIPNAVSVPLLPRTSGDKSGRPDLVTFCARITTWVTAAAVILLVALATPLVRVLLSPEFLPAVLLIRIIAPGTLVYAGSSVFAAYFRGIDRPDICSWAVGLGLSMNVIAVPLLFPTLGIKAAALGMAIGMVSRSALLSVVYYKMTSTRPSLGWLPQRGDVVRIKSLTIAAVKRVQNRLSINV